MNQILLFLLAFMDGTQSTLPYADAGLSEREAVIHLLSRLTFGARPSDIEMVLNLGIETWLEQQLQGDLPESVLDERLKVFPALAMDNRELFAVYPPRGAVLMMAIRDGVLSRDDAEDLGARRNELRAYARERGIKRPGELDRQLLGQKLARAVDAENQLREVLTDFWYNHFTVSILKNQARPFAISYERDAIRPNALGRFRDLLTATAKHPAMLLYLDNAASVADEGRETLMTKELMNMSKAGGFRGRMAQRQLRKREKSMSDADQDRRPRGLNENYARELLELHTLGVNGGYTQNDVTEAARVLTGWAIYPANERQRERIRNRIERGKVVGFVRQGDFLFRADAHDAEAKTVLGRTFPPGGGLQEGESLLGMLAEHPSTARFIATKLARHFVMDDPPERLVSVMATSFRESGGHIPTVIRTMVHTPEFWSEEARMGKIKTPFEYAVGTIRAVEGKMIAYRGVSRWIEKMGQPLYRAPAPNGFSDQGEHWVGAGTLVYRLRFAEALAGNDIHGLKVNWQKLAKESGAGTDPDSWWRLLAPGKGGLPEVVASASSDLPNRPSTVAGVVIASAEFQRK